MGVVTNTVSDAFSTANSYAQAATAKANEFVNTLNSWVYTPPQISVTWTSLAAPSLPSVPTAPSLPTITYTAPTGMPGAFVAPTLDFVLDDFTEVAPTLSFPSTPSVSYGSMPSLPTVGAVTVPDAPTLSAVSAPTLLTLSTVAFSGVDMHDSWLTRLENVPTLELLTPTPYSYARGADYASTLLTALKTKLSDRLNGGTGLSPAVEQALWDRARDREARAAQGNQAEVMRASEQLGFHLPAGVTAAQSREAAQNYFDKLSELSRDISVKQAELEQLNLRETISAGMQLEAQLIDYSYKLESLTFESAKAYAANAIDIYNASVKQFEALLSSYQTYSANYKTIIDAELARVEAYKAQLSGEQTKAQINSTLVQQYEAQIRAGMSQVEIYRAQVGAAQTLVQLEQAKVSMAGEQIRGYTAQVNAETAKVEAYKAGVQAELAKSEVFDSRVRAYGAKTSAQAEKARAEVARYTALIQGYATQWDGWKAAVQAESTRIEALGKQSGALLDGYRAATAAAVAEAEMTTKVWETNIRQYEAAQNLTLQTSKINSDNLIATNNARLDAAKTGAQVFSQLASSAYHMASANVSLNGGQSMGVSYSYSKQTTIDGMMIDP